MVRTTIRARIALVISIVAALAVAPIQHGNADLGSIIFFGSGFGHGIGMSQWGAYGLAQKGWTHEQILTHYFTDTTLGKNAAEPDKIRVGLVDGKQMVHVTAKNGPVTLRVGAPDAAPTATVQPGQTYLIKGGSGSYKIFDSGGNQVGDPIDGANKLYATYQDANAMLQSGEAGHTYNRGYIELNDYRPCADCGPVIRMIAVVTPQAYLYGLGEVPSSWPMEAMEAQADAARSYAEYLIAALGQARTGCNCGVYDDTRNQVYAAWDHEGEDQGERWVQAVDATDQEVVLYQGEVIDAQYMSSSGGYTENNENVWGGEPLPYLRGVCDPGDYTDANHNRVWQVQLTRDAVTSKLKPYTGDIGTVQRFTEITRGVSGRIRTLKVVGGSGTKTIYGSTLRGALGLLDDRVWINSNKNVTGTIRTKYDALECAPGMPRTAQRPVGGGTRQQFDNGAIYTNPSANRTVWLHGPIYSEYVQVGDGGGVLGLPTSKINAINEAQDCATQGCSKAQFANGFIFLKTDTGAHEVHGGVLDYFLQQNGVFGHLGFPTSDVAALKFGKTQATFQGKPGQTPITVTCTKSGTCTES